MNFADDPPLQRRRRGQSHGREWGPDRAVMATARRDRKPAPAEAGARTDTGSAAREEIMTEVTRVAPGRPASWMRTQAQALYRDAAVLRRRASELPRGYSGERAAMLQLARRRRGEAATLDAQADDLERA